MFLIIQYSQQMRYLRTIHVYFNYILHCSEPSVSNFNQYLNKILSKCQLAKSIVFLLLTQLNLRTTNLEGCCHLLNFLVLFWGGNTTFDFFFFLDSFFHFFSYCFFFLLFFFLFHNLLSCLFSPGSRSLSTSFNTSKAFVFVIRISTRVSVSTCNTRTVLIPECLFKWASHVRGLTNAFWQLSSGHGYAQVLLGSLTLLMTRPSSGKPFFDFFMLTKLTFFFILSSSCLITKSTGSFSRVYFSRDAPTATISRNIYSISCGV